MCVYAAAQIEPDSTNRIDDCATDVIYSTHAYAQKTATSKAEGTAVRSKPIGIIPAIKSGPATSNMSEASAPGKPPAAAPAKNDPGFGIVKNFSASGLDPTLASAGRSKTELSFSNALHPVDAKTFKTTIHISTENLAGMLGERHVDSAGMNGLTIENLQCDSKKPVTGIVTGGPEFGEQTEWPGIQQRAFSITDKGTQAGHFTTPGGTGSFSRHIPMTHPNPSGDPAGTPKSDSDIAKLWMHYPGKTVASLSEGITPVPDPADKDKTLAYLVNHYPSMDTTGEKNPMTVTLHSNVDKQWLDNKYSAARMKPDHKDTCVLKNDDSPTGWSIAVQPKHLEDLKNQFKHFLPANTQPLNVVLTSSEPGVVSGSITLHTGPKEANPSTTVADVAQKHGIDIDRWNKHCIASAAVPAASTVDAIETNKSNIQAILKDRLQ